MPADPTASFVRSACQLGPVPQVPEIRLHLAADMLGLWQRTEDEFGADQPPPFWAFPWPGGQALARYLLDHRDLVAGRRVLDLGSGSGLVAIAAAMAGAAQVRASEIDPLAAAAIKLNAQANGVPVPAIAGDMLDGDGEGAQVVLAGDIGRAFLPRHRFRVLDARDIPVLADLEDSDVKRTMIWTPAW